MNLPCTIMASTALAAVSQAREAKDHVRDPIVYSWKEGLSGLLLDSVGLGASIDNIFTSGSTEEGCVDFNCTEMNPRYETALAALSGGPFAISDGNGDTDKAMVMHSCMADGSILRTTEQMAMLDAGLKEGFADLKEFDIWSASTTISAAAAGGSGGSSAGASGEQRWTYVLSTFLPRAVELTPADLGYALSAELVAWDKWSSLDPSPLTGGNLQLRTVTTATPLGLRACPRLMNPRMKNWIYTVVAERPCGSCYAFIGEMNKVAAVSLVRFTSIVTATSQADASKAETEAETTTTVVVAALTVAGVGSPGEVVSLGAVGPAPELKLSVAEVIVGKDGTFEHSWGGV